jgi:hypothetical protein
MPRTKKNKVEPTPEPEEKVEEVAVEPAQEVVAPESEAKIKYRALIARYKVINPLKYKLKEKEFLSKLEGMK